MPNSFQSAAERMIRHIGGRVTAGRVKILSLLLAEQQAITHRQIERRLSEKLQLDRVTLYRVLDWLANKGLIHKVTSDDRVWRFRANHDMHTHQHAHFKCINCAKVVCLDQFPAGQDWPLPSGYQFQEVELTVKGLCAKCT